MYATGPVSSLLPLCLHFIGHFPGGPGLACTRMSPFWILLVLRMMETVVTTRAIKHAKLWSKCHHQQTNSQLFTCWMTFLLPSQQCQITEGRTDGLARPKVTLGSSNLVIDQWRLLSSLSSTLWCQYPSGLLPVPVTCAYLCRCWVSRPVIVWLIGIHAVWWKTALLTLRGSRTLNTNWSTFSWLAHRISYV